MKTTSLIPLSVLTALSLSASVFGQSKGGEQLAGTRTIISASALASSMTSPTDTRSVIDPSARGAFKTVAVYKAHLCTSCRNTEVTTGAGKLATRTVEHSCKTAASCCK